MLTQNAPVIIITGPTASGKTALVDNLARTMPITAINADVGQFYVPLSIGTAKPAWRTLPYPSALFDICDAPQSLDVRTYASLVDQEVVRARAQGRVPVLVGGSMFYLYSLFFPPCQPGECDASRVAQRAQAYAGMAAQQRRLFLAHLDPAREQAILPNDTYRVDRALEIWARTGLQPSTLQPSFIARWPEVRFVYVHPGLTALNNNIALRTDQMLVDGWIQEAQQVATAPQWKSFLTTKGLVGYPELFAWLDRGSLPKQYPALVEDIKAQTRQYARRQEKFWRRFVRDITQAAPVYQIHTINPCMAGQQLSLFIK